LAVAEAAAHRASENQPWQNAIAKQAGKSDDAMADSRAARMPEAVHNQLLDSVPDGVFTVDSEWRVTFFNRAAEQITGIKRADAVGRRCCDVFHASICESS
jgi:PAS domain-containing protein